MVTSLQLRLVTVFNCGESGNSMSAMRRSAETLGLDQVLALWDPDFFRIKLAMAMTEGSEVDKMQKQTKIHLKTE